MGRFSNLHYCTFKWGYLWEKFIDSIDVRPTAQIIWFSCKCIKDKLSKLISARYAMSLFLVKSRKQKAIQFITSFIMLEFILRSMVSKTSSKLKRIYIVIQLSYVIIYHILFIFLLLLIFSIALFMFVTQLKFAFWARPSVRNSH